MASRERLPRLLKVWKAEVATLNFSSSISVTMAQAYAIKMLNFDVGLLGTMVLLHLAAAGAGFVAGSVLVSALRPRRLALWKLFGALNRCLWALTGFTHLLPGGYGAAAFLSLVSAAQLSGSIASIASSDVGADLISKERAVRFFSSLNSVGLAANSAGLITATAIFRSLPPEEGYRVSYSLALASAALSSALLSLLKDLDPPPRGTSSGEALKHMAEVLKDGECSSYMKTVVAFTLVVNLPGALWNYYLLRVLGGDEAWVTLKAIAANLSQSLGYKFWGSISRRLGMKRTLYVSMALTSPIPTAFTLLPTLEGQIALEIYSGFAWSGYNLANSIYTLYLPKRAARIYFVASLNAISNVVASTSSRLGAQLASVGLAAMNSLFYASTLSRAVMSLVAKRTAPELPVR